MGHPGYHALSDPHRSPDDVIESTGTEQVRRTGTVWLVHRHIREAVLGVMLTKGRAMTIRQILTDLESRDVRIGSAAHPQKAISDALRYQTAIGRVRRLRRGLYEVRLQHMPRTTAWRMRRRLEDRSWPWASWEVADTRTPLDVPLLPEMRSEAYRRAPESPGRAGRASAGALGDLPSIDEIAANWPILSD